MALVIASAQIPGFEGAGRDAFNKLVSVRQWTLTGTYATGGHPYAPGADLNLRVLALLEALGPFRNASAAILPVWDRANRKLMFFWGDNDNAADAPSIEVANTTSLSNYVGLVRGTGY